MRKLFTLLAGMLIASAAWADAVYEPLIVESGFNRDVIAEVYDPTPTKVVKSKDGLRDSIVEHKSFKYAMSYFVTDYKSFRYTYPTRSVLREKYPDIEDTTTVEVSKKRYNLINSAFPDDNGQPEDRRVNCLSSKYPGLYWILGDYTQPNALCIRHGHDTKKQPLPDHGVFKFKNVGCYQKLFFAVVAGGFDNDSEARVMHTKVHYSSGAPTETTFDLYDHANLKDTLKAFHDNIFDGDDWVTGTWKTKLNCFAAICKMDIDHTRLIDSIVFTYQTEKETAGIAIFAVTGLTADIAAPEMKEDAEATTELVDNSFNIHWNAVDGATSYRVDVATDEDFHHMVDGYNNETVTGTDTIISNIGSGTEYYWRVRAVDSEGGQGKSSAPKRVKTSGSPATREDANSIEAEMAALKTEGTETDLTILRTLYKDGYFNTLCLPFDLASLDGTPLAGGELFEFVSATADGENLLEINIAPVEGNVVEAGKPYLIRWANTGEVLTTLVFNGVTVTTSTGQSVGDGVQFVGHIGMEQIEYENHYNLFLGGNNQLYWPISDGTIMKGFRAYFAIPTGGSTPAPVRRGTPAKLTIRSNVPTSVSSIQEQSNIPAKIIENGQLVIIKNGVRYNTTGQQIH